MSTTDIASGLLTGTSAERPNADACVGGIVLAAGRGARFAASASGPASGSSTEPDASLPKTLAVLRGESLVQHACRAVLAAGVRQAVVVVGYHGDALARAVAPLQGLTDPRLEIVDNPSWATGMSTSVIAGLEHLTPDITAALLMPADQPLLEARHLRLLIHTFQSTSKTIVAAAAEDGRLRGAPALFARVHFPRLKQLEGDRGARDLLRALAHEVVPVSLGTAALRDVDTHADLEDARAIGAGGIIPSADP